MKRNKCGKAWASNVREPNQNKNGKSYTSCQNKLEGKALEGMEGADPHPGNTEPVLLFQDTGVEVELQAMLLAEAAGGGGGRVAQ
jgi:hypothetical protein